MVCGEARNLLHTLCLCEIQAFRLSVARKGVARETGHHLTRSVSRIRDSVIAEARRCIPCAQSVLFPPEMG